MSKANVSLSEEELGLVSTTRWIELKQRIMEKAGHIFSAAAGDINDAFLTSGIPEKYSLPQLTPKISKGEQYRGLPYMVLDYPRIFEGPDVFSLRTFFWWGNFFSVSIHLAGKYKSVFLEGKKDSIFDLSPEWFFCVNESPWHQYFDEDNFIKTAKIDPHELLSLSAKRKFIRIAEKTGLENWNNIPASLKSSYGKMARLLA